MPPASWPALFTEIVGQASTYFYQGGQFAEQKIALLDGFDYENIGMVDGYEIVDKQLVKKDELEEMYSSSAHIGGHSHSNVSAEEEFEGLQDRSLQQGLKNYKKPKIKVKIASSIEEKRKKRKKRRKKRIKRATSGYGGSYINDFVGGNVSSGGDSGGGE
jgi:hypothetical protein